MKDLSRVLTRMKRLIKLELAGNPLCQKAKYRDRVITMGMSIGMLIHSDTVLPLFLFISIALLDDHEVSDTEKQFLMNWKKMRKARRRQQKQSLERMSHFFDETLPSTFSSVPAPPTLPALPARQLPHRCKKRNTAGELPSITQIHQLPQLLATDEVKNKIEVEENFKLPELVPYQSIIAQQGHQMNALSNYLPETSWRAIEVNGPVT